MRPPTTTGRFYTPPLPPWLPPLPKEPIEIELCPLAEANLKVIRQWSDRYGETPR